MLRRALVLLAAILACLGSSARSVAQDKPAAVSQPFGFPEIPRFQAPAAPALGPPVNEFKADIPISPNTGMPRSDEPTEKVFSIIESAAKSSAYIDYRYVVNSADPDRLGLWEKTTTHFGDQIHRLVQDYRNFYLTENMLYVGVAVAVAAPLANTNADQGIRNWYQRQAGGGISQNADRTADFFRGFGEWQYTLPLYLAMSCGGGLFNDHPTLAAVGEFGDRSWRALAVGAPMVGILQVGLGADRPYTDSSHWQPFRSSHAVSGHAFVGAVPFLTAASMTDSYALKTLLIAGSFGPAWSRIHTDDHYFSQVFLGWSIAALSVQSVNHTESHWRIVPCEVSKGMGMGVLIQY